LIDSNEILDDDDYLERRKRKKWRIQYHHDCSICLFIIYSFAFWQWLLADFADD